MRCSKTDKISHSTEKGAINYQEKLNQNIPYTVYYCKHCRAYHISKKGMLYRKIIHTVQRKRGKLLNRISKYRAVWQVELYGITHTVIYNEEDKTIRRIKC